MDVKLIEIRDRMTMIGAVAIRISGEDGPLARRCGYGEPCVLLTRLQGGQAKYDPYEWGDRTMLTAHVHLQRHWDEIRNGAVLDVEFVLGETDRPKESEV